MKSNGIQADSVAMTKVARNITNRQFFKIENIYFELPKPEHYKFSQAFCEATWHDQVILHAHLFIRKKFIRK